MQREELNVALSDTAVVNQSIQQAQLDIIISKIQAAKSTDDLFSMFSDDLRAMFKVQQITLYAVDREKRELFSKFIFDSFDTVQEIRVPIDDRSVSGFCARYGKVLNIADVYDEDELSRINPSLGFDCSWDERSGFRTRQILAVPILYERKYLMGILLLLNRKDDGPFTEQEEEYAREIASALSVALRQHYQVVQSNPPRRTTKFGYLLEHELISREELETAIADARRKKQDVEAVLLDQYRVPKAEIGKSLSAFYGCPFVEYDEKITIDPALIKGINFDYLKTNRWVPLRREEDTVDILLDNPKDLQKIEHIHLLMKGCTLRFFVGLQKDILQYLYSASGKRVALDSIEDILGELSGDADVSFEDDPETEAVNEDDSAVVRLANQIIIDAYNRGASDIHIEPYTARQDTVVRIRVDGLCREYQRIPPTYRRALVSRLKIMSRLDIAERRKPQDGKIKFRLPNRREIELRVATIPTANNNEDVVMRILAAAEPMPVEQLRMTPRNFQGFSEIIKRPYGLVLVVGPTGSGKTTTLHSALGVINTPDRKIWTAEDPVEITQYGLRQVQVNARIGFTFAAAMRSFLRADPDVVMVGEMRDEETAHIGIEASLTGHLVFSTLHTNSAVETVTRLLDMGLDPFNFADALLGVLAQRLVRTLCSACKAAYHPPKEIYQELEAVYGAEAWAALKRPYDDDFKLQRAVGCTVCGNTGYKGRIGIHELLLSSGNIKQLIQSRARVDEIVQAARQEGMTTLVQDGILKVLDGWTDIAQVRAVASC
jgi:type II secretory ATPase GspE/PulE/Tfp pilus assembly ATPase PilB-like protein/GAF domain-containing protein